MVTPRAVAFSSSSSSSSRGLEDAPSEADEVCVTGLMSSRERVSMFSFELVMMRSDSLSLSSYSSWLLVPVALKRRMGSPGGRGSLRSKRRLLRPCWSTCTRIPFRSRSSAAEEREEDEGWEAISIQDSV